MVFSDLFFLFVFLPLFGICYLLGTKADKLLQTKKENKCFTLRNLILVIFSLIFYAWGEPVYVFLMFICVLMNYIIGRWIESSDSNRKTALAIGVACNVLVIGIFKYAGFFAGILIDCGLTFIPKPHIALPIGISFYTFQSISYLIDVYRKESAAQHKFVNLLLYISMFPQLIAGPIVRYNTVAEEINDRHVSSDDMADGLYRFFIGLSKKVILANQLSEISGFYLSNGLNTLTTAGAWLGIIAFTLQIYFDFSGYSDMAIGIGRCLGFHFNENFNHPYCCKSISEFWRRWHMSLGSFFRDYVYIPMGGNRRHQILNILVVWFLTGIWHGASWNFIMWGLYFGFIVMMEKYTLLKVQKWIPAFILHIYSLILIVLGWGIFYFDDLKKMGVFFSHLFGFGGELYDFKDTGSIYNYMGLWILALLLCMPLRTVCGRLLADKLGETSSLFTSTRLIVRTVISIASIILCAALLVGATNNAFIYTRF